MLKHLQNICKNVLVFYFTCNHGLTLAIHDHRRCNSNACNISRPSVCLRQHTGPCIVCMGRVGVRCICASCWIHQFYVQCFFEKGQPFIVAFVGCQPIFIIFGRHTLQESCRKRIYKHPPKTVCVVSVLDCSFIYCYVSLLCLGHKQKLGNDDDGHKP